MILTENILAGIKPIQQVGPLPLQVSGIAFDSRKIKPGNVFVAEKGLTVDGHLFIDKAIEKGAKLIICEELPAHLQTEIGYWKVESSREVLGHMAHAFFDRPSEKLTLVGVTGTNGKTSVTTMLYQLFKSLGFKVGLLSTVENRVDEEVIPARYTTPDSITINELLSKMVDAGCTYVFMEASSHAIDQRRISGLQFDGTVFTNITHDHLDYHKTFKAYMEAKKRLFDDLPSSSFALLNKDDKRGPVMAQNTKANVRYFSLRRPADFKAKLLEVNFTGLYMEIGGREFYSPVLGEFNAYNLLAAYGTACLLGLSEEEVLVKLSAVKGAEGRFEPLVFPDSDAVGIIDYAHTPDALEKVLTTIDKTNKGAKKIITVVGCGGDRDKEKRPMMAKIATTYSDQVILTSDNPRTENPQTIITDMEAGVPPFGRQKVLSIINRREAIRTAARLAGTNAIVLVAGKGHEKYQEIGKEKISFDDKAELAKAFRELA